MHFLQKVLGFSQCSVGSDAEKWVEVDMKGGGRQKGRWPHCYMTSVPSAGGQMFLQSRLQTVNKPVNSCTGLYSLCDLDVFLTTPDFHFLICTMSVWMKWVGYMAAPK